MREREERELPSEVSYGVELAWYGRRLPFLLKKPFLVDSSERGMGKASRLPKNPKAQESER